MKNTKVSFVILYIKEETVLEDNHVHTNYCPHGTPHLMEEYVKEAIKMGLQSLTFTEHAPLVIEDPTPEKDSAMSRRDVSNYLEEGQRLKEKYQGSIEINTGFEVDYIEGKEKETLEFLNQYSQTIPHSILSVHFIKIDINEYFCIDYSKEAFLTQAEKIGYDKLYQLYEESLYKALSLPFGEQTPKKIGHITLINKFKRAYTFEDPINWTKVLERVKQNGYQLDYNFAGLDKADYRESYPPEELIREAQRLAISFSKGSDAHQPREVARYFERSVVDG